MKHLATRRLVASHLQFRVYDASLTDADVAVLNDAVIHVSQDESKRGWIKTGDAICYFTVGDLWDYRLDVWFADCFPGVRDAERVLAHNLHFATGKLSIVTVFEEVVQVSVPPGEYALYVYAYNLDIEADSELDDDTFLKRDDLERYEVVLVKGHAQREGVIHGEATLH